jgi:Stress up-regulated Nod 19
MATELMNVWPKSQVVMLTLTYEYIPYRPDDFQAATSIWLDVGGCRSEVAVPDEQTSFMLSSLKWTSTVNGSVIAIVSHLHDGGVHLGVERNEDMVCKSTSTYGMMSKFEHHMSGMNMDHITVMSACNDVGRIKIGEDWTVKAYYDLSTHAPMLAADGKPEGVMGIGVLYVVED